LKVIVPVPPVGVLKLRILFTKTFGLSRSCRKRISSGAALIVMVRTNR
jgi:hypothetical protein